MRPDSFSRKAGAAELRSHARRFSSSQMVKARNIAVEFRDLFAVGLPLLLYLAMKELAFFKLTEGELVALHAVALKR